MLQTSIVASKVASFIAAAFLLALLLAGCNNNPESAAKDKFLTAVKTYNQKKKAYELSVRGIFVQVAWHFLLERPGFSG